MDRMDKALDRALALIENGESDIRELIADLPKDEADRVRDLLETVHWLGEQAIDLPGPVSKAANRAGLIAMVDQARQEAENSRWFDLRERLASKIWRPAAATAAVLALSGGVASAAVSSQPTSPLYPVKRAIEWVRVSLPQSDYQAARLNLGLAETRLDEVEAVGRKDKDIVKQLERDLDAELGKARELADKLIESERESLLRRYRELQRRRQGLRGDDDDNDPDRRSRDEKDKRSQGDRRPAEDDDDEEENYAPAPRPTSGSSTADDNNEDEPQAAELGSETDNNEDEPQAQELGSETDDDSEQETDD